MAIPYIEVLPFIICTFVSKATFEFIYSAVVPYRLYRSFYCFPTSNVSHQKAFCFPRLIKSIIWQDCSIRLFLKTNKGTKDYKFVPLF